MTLANVYRSGEALIISIKKLQREVMNIEEGDIIDIEIKQVIKRKLNT